MNKIKLIVVNCTLLIVSSCGEALMDDNDINTDTPIVESYLTEGANSLSVKVFSMEEYLKDEYKLSKPITGLQIKVNDKDLTETATAGVYSLDLGADTLRGGQEFNLQFTRNGTTIAGSATIPQKITNLSIEPQSMTLSSSSYWNESSDTTAVVVSWDDPGQDYYQVYIQSPNVTDMPGMGIFGRRMMQPFKGNSYRATARDFRTVGVHWIYVYRVGKDYVELYERISSTDLANPASFIQNGLGIFTGLSVTGKSFYVYESE